MEELKATPAPATTTGQETRIDVRREARDDDGDDTETMADLIERFDWSATPLGKPATWPPSLQNALSLCLASRFPMAICWGPELILLYNDAYGEILGAKHPAALGRPVLEVWSEVRAIVAPMMEGVRRTGRATWADDLMLPIDRNGYTEEAFFTASYSAIRDGASGGGILVTVTETTARVLVERRLRLLRDLAQTAAHARSTEEVCANASELLAAHAHDVPFSLIYLIGANGEARLARPAPAALPAAAAPPSIPTAPDPTDDEPQTAIWPLRSVVATGDRAIVHGLGARLPAFWGPIWPEPVDSAVVLPIARPGQMRPYGMLVAGVSPRRALDEHYLDFLKLCASHIAQALTAARTRQQAEEASLAKDQFLAMLGHELRNPLSPILTALQLMNLRGMHSREQEVIERQVGHLVRLVDDLLDVARITRGKIELRREPLELASVVVKGIELASPLLEQRKQRVTVDVPPDGLEVNADDARLAQVVSNLLTNAAKYSEPGSRIFITATREGDRARLSVRDEGIGIAPEMLDTIFESFVQHRQALDRASGGLGLGLAIVRSLVRMHGGTVSAHSDGPGRGSEFRVELPLADGLSVVESSGDSDRLYLHEPQSNGGSDRVLVVDDNQDGAELLAETLRELGHKVEVAHDGPTALEIAKRWKPQLALLDIGLPVMDGYELAGKLRALADGTPIRLVAVTGYGQETDRRRSAEAGFSAHLVKPVDLDVLTTVVQHDKRDDRHN